MPDSAKASTGDIARFNAGHNMSVRISVLVAAVIVVWAAIINLDPVVHPLSNVHFYSGVVLAASVAIQRLGSVQSWLAKPHADRLAQIQTLAQITHMNLCMGRSVDRDLTDLRVHVWEVPRWYRRMIPYGFRSFLRRHAPGRRSEDDTKWIIRPNLVRVAAVGLVPQAPSGIRFRKGVGLVGVCVASNDRSEYSTLNIESPKYRTALRSATEDEWRNYGPKVTHNLSLADASKLSHSYGQVLGKVIQDTHSGEAIGCVTVSVKTCAPKAFNFRTDKKFRESVTDLAQSVAPLLA